MLEKEITWISANAKLKSDSDIRVTVSPKGWVRISISPSCMEKISETGFIQYGFGEAGNKMFFREADEKTGYKGKKDGNYTIFTLTGKKAQAVGTFAGEYEMRIEQSLGYVYIDRRRQK